jgi:hypothetical protein
LEKLPFIPGHVYHRRSEIHSIYGGNWQGGICPSSTSPFIFIFSGKSGKLHGYQDGWDNPNVYSYTGEGQIGDMQFTRGNLALRDHKQNGKRVFLFEAISKGYIKFISDVEVFDADYFETHDSSGDLRIGIKFFLKRVGAHIPLYPEISIRPPSLADPHIRLELDKPTVTERKGLVTSRVGQGAYRKRIIHRWEYKCAVTGFDKLDVLIASHIVPWAESTDPERLDIHNGILLSPTYDALFDRHLISFENNGSIILSDTIDYNAYKKIRVYGNERIVNLSSYNIEYLERHRLSLDHKF